MLEISFALPSLPKSGALVLLVPEGAEPPSRIFTEADAAISGGVTRVLEATAFKPKKAKSCDLPAPGAGLARIVVVGLGEVGEGSRQAITEAGGEVASALAREPEIVVDATGLSAELCAALAEGLALRSYRFDRYRTREEEEEPADRLKIATILCEDPEPAGDFWRARRQVVAGVHLARDLVSEPANVLTPQEMADRCRRLEELGVKVEIHGVPELKKLGFGALLGVAQGSDHPPAMVVMQWQGAPAGKGRRKTGQGAPIAFIGKGVTFDSGGISLKPGLGMEEMKFDMAGAAAVVGAMAALAGRKAKVNAVGVIGLVENMPSGKAQRPGDVVRTYSGQTVEVVNTDAEGRLVLADLLWYCQQKFAPRVMIDLATLTGAIIVGLGSEYAGLFSNDDDLAARLADSGSDAGEKLWRMPLHAAYAKLIKSDIADIKNSSGRPAGSITAAQFLQRFVNDRAWAHLDIAGTAWVKTESSLVPKGATAFGVRLLDRLAEKYFEG